MLSRPVSARAQHGFTLTELAVVVAIVALLIGGTLMTLAAQSSAREFGDTQRTLELARDALAGFAIVNGRLPCPAVAGTGGVESPVGGGACTAPEGFVPAVTLGIGPTDVNGALLDAWGYPIRYRVTTVASDT